MKPAAKLLLIVVAIIGIVVALYSVRRNHGSHGAVSTTVSQPAPDFSLPQLNGQISSPFFLSGQSGSSRLLGELVRALPCRDAAPHRTAAKIWRPRTADYRSSPWMTVPTLLAPSTGSSSMNYPVVMGNAKTGELYGGVLGLPIAFLIDRDGRIKSKHIGATEPAVFEKEIATLLHSH